MTPLKHLQRHCGGARLSSLREEAAAVRWAPPARPTAAAAALGPARRRHLLLGAAAPFPRLPAARPGSSRCPATFPAPVGCADGERARRAAPPRIWVQPLGKEVTGEEERPSVAELFLEERRAFFRVPQDEEGTPGSRPPHGRPGQTVLGTAAERRSSLANPLNCAGKGTANRTKKQPSWAYQPRPCWQ